MKPQHPYRLRPYHNPERVDDSKVPRGWRLLYADEAANRGNVPRFVWIPSFQAFYSYPNYDGHCLHFTYAVQVNQTAPTVFPVFT